MMPDDIEIDDKPIKGPRKILDTKDRKKLDAEKKRKKELDD
jgi:hypothetical protein